MIEMETNLTREIIFKGKRLDGRAFDKYRDITIETDVIKNAEGSARVKLGETDIIVGVKASIGTPYADTPDEGVITVSAELVPLASPEFEAGPPGEEGIELARVVDRAIRESKCIDFGKLCLVPEKAVWMVFVDIEVLNDDGNLIDAANIAATCALLRARLPELEKKEEGGYVTKFGTKSDQKIPITGIPVSATFAKMGQHILVDPGLEELRALDARLTVGTIDKDGEIKLCSMQKGGSEGLTYEEVEKIFALAVEKGEGLRSKIREAVKG